jgi:hypothetical protein
MTAINLVVANLLNKTTCDYHRAALKVAACQIFLLIGKSDYHVCDFKFEFHFFWHSLARLGL